MAEHHLVIGGNAAGMTAASRAKRLRPSLSITVLEASHYISYSICGLPYWVGGARLDSSDGENAGGVQTFDLRRGGLVSGGHQ